MHHGGGVEDISGAKAVYCSATCTGAGKARERPEELVSCGIACLIGVAENEH
jgi:hypothetical protein